MTTTTNMAAAALLAELKFRDGAKKQISVNVQNNLTSLIAAVQELNTSTSRLLSELVEQEKSQGDFAQGRCDVTASITRARFCGFVIYLANLPQVRKTWRRVTTKKTSQRSLKTPSCTPQLKEPKRKFPTEVSFVTARRAARTT